MPNVKTKRHGVGTPRFSGLELMDRINAMYQSGYIGSETKAEMTNMILEGMNTGDYTELFDFVNEQCLCKAPENPFWKQMKEILSEEEKE